MASSFSHAAGHMKHIISQIDIILFILLTSVELNPELFICDCSTICCQAFPSPSEPNSFFKSLKLSYHLLGTIPLPPVFSYSPHPFQIPVRWRQVM